MRIFARALFTLIIALIAVSVYAQDLNSIDYQNLRSSDLSDAQVQQLWKRAQSQGLSLSDVQKMAIARGMQPSEVSKLVARVRNLRMQQSAEQTKQFSSAEMRKVQADSLLSERQVDSTKAGKGLKIFGSNLFNRKKVTFTPSLNIATPSDYELGPGDELVIDIWGAAEQTYRLPISPEGTISIDNLGPVYVNGLTIEEARDRLTDKLSQIYSGLKPAAGGRKDTYARISLGNIRSIKVTVLGEARVPGTYTLPSLATVFNALYVSGGPDSNGTYRSIQVIRGDRVVDTLDVYDFLVYGDQSDNIRLRDQDIIKIDPYKNHVELEGETKRTGIFEVRDGETIQDLLTFAGGFTDEAYKRRIKITGNTPTERRIDDILYPEHKDFKLRNGDKVKIGRVLDRYANRVEIQGAVFREGEYELNDTTTVYSLIQRADGLRGDAFMNRGLIYRTRPDYTVEAIPFSVRDVINNPEENDIPLIKDDIVKVSSIFDLREDYTVQILGAVQQPGRVPFVENMTLKDLIFQANGFKRSAAPYRVEVARRIESKDSTFVPTKVARIYQFNIGEDLKLEPKGAKFVLQPFDKVFVRTSPAYQEQEDVTVKGEVMFPGEYTLSHKDTRISDLIERAGGLTEYAYINGGNLTRRTEEGPKPDGIQLNVPDSVQLQQQLGRNTMKVGIDLEKVLQHPGSKYDLILKEGDVLEIPKRLQTVKVTGEVLYPVNIRYEKGRSFREYVRSAGGSTEQGNMKRAYIVYANGEVDRSRKFIFFRSYPDVKPGATIFVPKKAEGPKLSPQERIGIYSALVSMAAIVSNTIFQITR